MIGYYIMRKRTKSILEELNNMVSEKDRSHIIESRATHIIDSAIHLINEIRIHYDNETASELERRLLNSIRGQDPNKFKRGIRKLSD